jgi:hypothetical protein
MTTTARKLKVIDCDSHFWQPLAIWEKFIDAQYREPIVTAVDHVIGGKPYPAERSSAPKPVVARCLVH